jgi:4-amino-4-deoxy-L-arabinose transferase-like glycosyltransferase
MLSSSFMRQAFLAVVLLSLACLLTRAARVGLAGDYLDPIAKISAQDEALYSHSAIRMAQQGPWLTPMFMGRLALYKPPMVVWTAALSARLLGISRLTLRLPVALISSLGAGLVFLFAARNRWQTGACAALLLISNHLWTVAGAMVLTDCLLASFEIAAFFCLLADPSLISTPALCAFAASIAAASLTKGVAGVLPVLAFALYCLLAPNDQRPRWSRACAALALAGALVVPWYAYQMMAHGRWFWAEHIQLEILGAGGGSMPQTTTENHALFYLKRLALVDPILLALTLIALPAWFAALRKRSAQAVLLACWLAPVLAAVFLWHYRNAAYLIPSLPPMAIIAASYVPLPKGSARWLLAASAMAFVTKIALPQQPFGLSFAGGTIQTAAAPLSAYCALNRGNELIIGDAVDDLYATTLPLPKLRYAIVNSSMSAGQDTLDFPSMGITVTAAQFDNLPAWMPQFRQRLRAWGVTGDEPIATLIVAATPEQLMDVVRAHPQSDFFMPARFRASAKAADGAGHDWRDAGSAYFLLLSQTRQPRQTPPAWTCDASPP